MKESIKTLWDILDYRVDYVLKKPVFVYLNDQDQKNVRVSAKKFRKDVIAYASHICVNDEKKNIAILSENSYRWIVAFFAITCSGNTAVLLDKNQSAEEIRTQLHNTECHELLYSNEFTDTASDLSEELKITCIDEYFDDNKTPGNGQDTKAFVPVREEDTPCVIAFTSGTTGDSKGVLLTHRNIVANILSCAEHTTFTDYRVLLVLPLHHMFGLTISMLVPFYTGATIYINNNLRYLRRDLKRILPDSLFVVPAYLSVVSRYFDYLKNNDLLPDRPMKLVCGGASLTEKWKSKFKNYNVHLFNAYGITECAPGVAANSYDDPFGKLYPLNGVEIRIHEPDKNGIGEIMIKSDTVFDGYVNKPEETREAFEDGWFLTGDMGKLDENGALTITGRKKRLLILSNGENVSAEELESYLQQMEGVLECLVYDKDDRIYAEIYADKEKQLSIKEEIKTLNRKLPVYKNIDRVVFREEAFEKNNLGKIIFRKE